MLDFDAVNAQQIRAIIDATAPADLAAVLGAQLGITPPDAANVYPFATGVLKQHAAQLLARAEAAEAHRDRLIARVAELEAAARKPGIPAGYAIGDDLDAIRDFEDATRAEYDTMESES